MNCPLCNQPMHKTSEDVTSNQKEGSAYKEYDRTIYHCESCDTWANTEVPKTTDEEK